MLSRIQITTMVFCVIVPWAAILIFSGSFQLSTLLNPFSIVVSIDCVIFFIFNKYLWSWRIFHGWLVNRPDIRGTWEATLKSNWIDKDGNKVNQIKCYAVIRQTLTHLSLRLITPESRSLLVAGVIDRENDGLFRIIGVYRNQPKIELQEIRSRIHHGAFVLEIYGSPPSAIEGHYWTDRNSHGGMELKNRNTKLCECYAEAVDLFK